MADIWDRVDEAIDRDPLLLRGIVAEVLAERDHALAELSSLRDHRARWETEHERAERLAAELAEARAARDEVLREFAEERQTLGRVRTVAAEWGEPYHCGWLSASVLVRQLRAALDGGQ